LYDFTVKEHVSDRSSKGSSGKRRAIDYCHLDGIRTLSLNWVEGLGADDNEDRGFSAIAYGE
jgi:hypothetical protein